MNHFQIADELERNQELIQNLLKGKSPDSYIWKKSPDKWSLLEIICHLYDEEQLDFRARAKHILYTPKEIMPPIDPEGWVIGHDYAAQDYEKTLANFIREREESIKWLRSLEYPNWEQEYNHPFLGIVTARMFLENWLAHDYLHIRQIVKVNYLYLRASSNDNFRYAGDW